MREDPARSGQHFILKGNTLLVVVNNGILLPKLFWPTVRKKCFCDREKPLEFEAEGSEFAKFLRSLDQFIQTESQKIYFFICCVRMVDFCFYSFS